MVNKRYFKPKDLFLSSLFSILLSLAFSSFNFWFFAFVAFIPFFFVLRNKQPVQVFILSYLTGVFFWIINVYWLIHVTFLGLIVLIFYLSFYFAIFGLIFSSMANRLSPIGQLFFIPSLWVCLEYARSYLFGGFPWSLLAHSQYSKLILIQIADVTGAWGVSWVVMMGNVAVWQFVTGLRVKGYGLRNCLLPVLCILVTLGYGYYKIYHLPLNPYHLSLKISLIQGNISQDLKWNPRAINFIFNRYKELTDSAAKDKPDLIIWPEASSPVLFGDDDEFFRDIFSLAPKAGAYLLVGAVEREENDYFNSALLINKEGNLSGTYHKLHLVPFGEYIPFKKTFPFLQTIAPIGDIERGKDYTVFNYPLSAIHSPLINFSVLICFEDLFPELSREFVRRGAGFLVNITNDAWYKETSAPFQHFSAAVFRAVENRVNLARSANTGITGFISPQGKLNILKGDEGKEIFVPGFLTQEISINKQKPTFYNRYGDLFVLACLLLAGIIWVRYARLRQ